MLTRYGRMAVEHWKEARPIMLKYLEATQSLEKAAHFAQEMAKQEKVSRMMRGLAPELAEESALMKFILLPPECVEPELTLDQCPFVPMDYITSPIPHS